MIDPQVVTLLKAEWKLPRDTTDEEFRETYRYFPSCYHLFILFESKKKISSANELGELCWIRRYALYMEKRCQGRIGMFIKRVEAERMASRRRLIKHFSQKWINTRKDACVTAMYCNYEYSLCMLPSPRSSFFLLLIICFSRRRMYKERRSVCL